MPYGTKIDSKSGDHLQTYLIIPCFNEAVRFQRQYWEILANNRKINLIFVNDGSTDGTHQILQEFCQRNRASFVNLEQNLGKAEAIREGFIKSEIEADSAVGFLDADSAFTVETVNSFVNLFSDRQLIGDKALWSSRVKLAGRQIERSDFRHYISRVLITLILNHYRIKIYDTQSGFKIFSENVLDSVMRERFRTRWFVDIEILLRYRALNKIDLILWEEPVTSWRDVTGSRISFRNWLSIALEIVILFFRYRRDKSSNKVH